MLAVVDHGVGMTREQLVKANARLHGEEDFIVAPTRFLGHYVVGQLARRLGVEVELTVSPVNGIVARLLLPEELLATEDRTPAVVPTPPVRRPAAPAAAPAPAPVATQEPIQWPEADEEPAPESVFVPRQEQTMAPRTPEPVAQQSVSAGAVPAPARQQASTTTERTRNGLIKRAPKRTSGEARPTPVRPTTPKASGVTTVEPRSPEDVRSMLSKFRSGHERGASGEEETR
jgi:hypothetical protein